MAGWGPAELLTAAAAVHQVEPLEDWMPLAMAEIVQGLQAFSGRSQSVGQILARWGFKAEPEKPQMDDDQWLTFGRQHGQHASQV